MKKNKILLAKLALVWQKNVSQYSSFVLATTSFDISFMLKNKKVKLPSSTKVSLNSVNVQGDELLKKKVRKRITLQLIDYSKIDENANLRTVFSGLFQSLDAAVAVKVRVRMKELYGTDVFSVHDCFCCEARYADQVKQEYKKALFSVVFDQKLSDVLKIEGLDLSE